MGQSAKCIANRYSGVVNNFLKFPDGLVTLMYGQIGLAMQVHDRALQNRQMLRCVVSLCRRER